MPRDSDLTDNGMGLVTCLLGDADVQLGVRATPLACEERVA